MEKDIRIDWIDICKGIAIILVVLGHTIRDEMRELNSTYDIIYNFIYSFHMAFFMVLSGFLFGEQCKMRKFDVKFFLYKRSISLFLPFVSYSLLLYVCFLIANVIPFISNMLQGTGYSMIPFGDYIILVLLGENPYGVHVWFMYCLFIVSLLGLVFFVLLKKQHKYRCQIIVFFVGLMWILRYIIDPEITIVYRVMLVGMYYLLGMVWKDIFKRINKILYIILSIIAWSGVFCYSVCLTIINVNDIYKLIINVLVCICIDNLVHMSCIITGKIKKLICILGKESFSIYLLHQPFFCAFLATIFLKLEIPFTVIILLCFTLSITVPVILTYYIRKQKVLKKIFFFLGIK